MTLPATRDHDPALEVLFHAIDTGALPWPRTGGALFLRARDGWPLHAAGRTGLVCEQTFKPAFDALQRSQLMVQADPVTDRFPLVLVLPPRQRDEARALFARAVSQCTDDGVVLACMQNDEGAKTGQSDLAKLAGPVSVLSKQHCRVFWTTALAIDETLRAEWRDLDAPRAIVDGRYTSRPGLFAWDRIDPASALLVKHLPADLAGRGADLGAGWGYLATEVFARAPKVTALDLYEAEARALDLARTNLAGEPRATFHWSDVGEGLPRRNYDFIVSNPPFHAHGRADRPDIGRRFITAAADALRPGGRLFLVANRHLPYESVLDARFGTTRTLAQAGGFKVVEAVRGK
ncbi:16S rRNA methyltransferase [Lysobacter helvus]|uniref:16S rRNA methyltransferase n=2 Tax=Lysobacteraceae TaxID=32033 RepID=A0ABM7Q5L8_9GAMM|nr:16S rRNA methyltransferase [Lysobacter caseinilyticus]BCT95700.1 16S rRNA methyltransferase [Lysobacter helvus]